MNTRKLFLKKNFCERGIINYKFLIYKFNIVTKKLSKYAETCLSPLKKLKNELEHRDVVFVTQQSQRWTTKELDV
jgi:hypothetical protein